jgi:type I restriction enzyme S subunit
VSGDINQKEIFDCEGRITELGLENSNARYLPINSVLIALNGQGKTRGTVAILRTKATCNQSLVSIYPNDINLVLPELLFANLDGRYDEIRRLTGDSGNDRRGLNMPIIRNISFSFPKSLEEQQAIVRQLDSLRAETQKLEAVYQQKLVDLEELKKSILQKAFAGELTDKSIAS